MPRNLLLIGRHSAKSPATIAATASPAARSVYPEKRPAMRGRYLIRNKWKARLVWLADLLLRPLAWHPRPAIPARPQRILLANNAHIGDVLLTVPVIKWLRNRFPDAEIGYLAGSWAQAALEPLAAGLAHIHYVDPFLLNRSNITRGAKLRRHLVTAWHFLVAARRIRYDVAIDLYQSLGNAVPLLWLTGIPVRIGWTSAGLGSLLTHPVDRIDADRSMWDYPRDLLNLLGMSEFDRLVPYYPTRAEDFPSHLLTPDSPYIVIHPNSGAPIRDWVDLHWRAVAERLAKASYTIVVCGTGPRDQARGDFITEGLGAKVINATNRLSWVQFVALVARAAQVICLESMAQHVASALQRPTIVIFGGMVNQVQWGPLNPRATVLTHPTACAICHCKTCPARHCIVLTTPDDVIAAVAQTELPVVPADLYAYAK